MAVVGDKVSAARDGPVDAFSSCSFRFLVQAACRTGDSSFTLGSTTISRLTGPLPT